MRIVSLLPSATEIVCLLGLREALVGRSHECDFPADVRSVPVMTYSAIGVTQENGEIAADLTSAEIDALVSQQLADGQSLYGLYLDRLEAARPDLILTQELCDVCAVSYGTVRAAVRDLTPRWGGSAQVISLEPTDIEGIFDTILTVAELTGRLAFGRQQVQALRERLERVEEGVGRIPPAERPAVAALEWLDPPFAPGHWVPEQIERGGGRCVLGRYGKPSVRCRWEDVAAAQPSVVMVMPCGYDLAGAVRETQSVARLPVWSQLPALAQGQIYAVDATSYFSRPGPRVVDGVEILAGLLHPEHWPAPTPAQAQRIVHLFETAAEAISKNGKTGLNPSSDVL